MNRRKLWTWIKRAGLMFLAFFLTISLWQAPIIKTSAKDRIHGVWITNYGTALSYYTTRLDEVTANLAKHHINTIYPAVWNRGVTLHPSQVVREAGGPSRNPFTSLPLLPYQNSLKSFIHHAHRQHLRIIPWFEYGLWVPASSAIAQAHPDWLTTTIDGKITEQVLTQRTLPTSLQNIKEEWTGENQAWLNPSHPEVQKFFTDLILEVVENYDIDGIQLDDHFGIPIAFGYDKYTVQQYKTSHQGNEPPKDPSDPKWVAWRAEQITQLMGKIAKEVRSQKPDLIISLSPSPPNFAYQKYLQDWTSWAEDGLIDEAIVQIYREQPQFIQNELNREDFAYLQKIIPIGIGLYTGPVENSKPIDQIRKEVEVTQASGYENLSFFSWETTFWLLKKSSTETVKTVFHEMLDG